MAWFRYALLLGGAIRKWKEAVDQVNPLDGEFTGKRIKIQDLVNPATERVMWKKFISCELMGPANITFIGAGSIQGARFINCDLICLRPGVRVYNTAVFEEVSVLGGALYNCTIYLTNAMIPQFKDMPGVYFATRTGDPDLDNMSIIPTPPDSVSNYAVNISPINIP